MTVFHTETELSFGESLTVLRTKGLEHGHLHENELAITLEAMKKPPSTSGIQQIRDDTGFPSRNLNTVEILTDCVRLSVNERETTLWVYYPRRPIGETNRFCVLYLHAGSWFAGSPFVCENACRYLAEAAGCAVFNLDYALSPEHTYPAPEEDCLAAIDYIRQNAPRYGASADKLALAGESCGGQILLSSLYRSGRFGEISAIGLFYPCVSLDLFNAPFVWREEDFEMAPEHRPYILPRLVLGRADGKGNEALMGMIRQLHLPTVANLSAPEISPLNGDLSCLPPIFLATAEYDGLRPQGEYFGKAAKMQGATVTQIRYAGVHHAFLDKFGILPQAQHCIDRFASMLKTL